MAKGEPKADETPTGADARKTTRVGGFEIIERIGKGGMGAVYKARQVSMDRIVALKVLAPRLAKNADFVRRFLREARSAAKLSHPNIVQGIDVGHAGDYYYFAMEFVDGPTVKDLLKQQGPLDEKKALAVAADQWGAWIDVVDEDGHGKVTTESRYFEVAPIEIWILRTRWQILLDFRFPAA